MDIFPKMWWWLVVAALARVLVTGDPGRGLASDGNVPDPKVPELGAPACPWPGQLGR